MVQAVDGVSFCSGARRDTRACRRERLRKVDHRPRGHADEHSDGGRIEFEGQDITHYSKAQMRPLRRRMQMVYQDPYGSLDPRMKVRDIIGEPLVVHGLAGDRRDL